MEKRPGMTYFCTSGVVLVDTYLVVSWLFESIGTGSILLMPCRNDKLGTIFHLFFRLFTYLYGSLDVLAFWAV